MKNHQATYMKSFNKLVVTKTLPIRKFSVGKQPARQGQANTCNFRPTSVKLSGRHEGKKAKRWARHERKTCFC